MKNWTNEELDTVGKADELRIASLRKDGTLRSYRIIWVVRVDDGLYVRSVNGRDSDWFRGVRTRHEGRIQADGVEKDAAFEEITDLAVQKEIDSAYRAKYGHYPKEYVDNCLTPKALAATIKLVPRE